MKQFSPGKYIINLLLTISLLSTNKYRNVVASAIVRSDQRFHYNIKTSSWTNMKRVVWKVIQAKITW